MVNHQWPSHPAGVQTFQTVAHSQSESSKYFFTDCAPSLEMPPTHTFHFYAPTLSIASVNFSKQLTSLCKRVPSALGWQTCLSFLSSPAAGGNLDCRSQDLVLFLASIWLRKPFLSEIISAVKVSV